MQSVFFHRFKKKEFETWYLCQSTLVHTFETTKLAEKDHEKGIKSRVEKQLKIFDETKNCEVNVSGTGANILSIRN